VIIKKNLLSF